MTISKGSIIAAALAHRRKIRQQTAFIAQTIDNRLKLPPKFLIVQLGRMVEPARPELSAASAEIPPQVADTAALSICFFMTRIQPVRLFCFNRFPGYLIIQVVLHVFEYAFKRIQRGAGIITIDQ